jgi:hypothetical protein
MPLTLYQLYKANIMDWRHVSKRIMPTLQARSPEFRPQSHQILVVLMGGINYSSIILNSTPHLQEGKDH